MCKSKFKIVILLIMLAVFTTGCISFNTGSKAPVIVDSGVFKSTSKGEIWQHAVLIPTISGQPGSIAGFATAAMAMDPSDSQAIYFGSVGNGLFYSYDGAQSWLPAHSLGPGIIKAIAVDPDSKCIIYTAINNAVFKTTDCNRSWQRVYFDNDLTVTVNTIAIDHFNSEFVYIGTSRGEVIKSFDRGVSWQTLYRMANSIEKIVISPHDSRIIFTATANKGIHRSIDGGSSWLDLSENLIEFLGNTTYRDMVVAEAEPGLLYLATSYGLIRSEDNGDNWSKIELITPEQGAIINAIAVNPKNAAEIYYITNTTFYRSADSGKTWGTIKLPTSKTGWRILIDYENPSIIYLGVK